MDEARQRVQERFGTYAQNYVTSTVHSSGYTLDRLIELTDPRPGQRALDIATGGGHVALAMARRGASVIASDLTGPMLKAARQHIQAEGVQAEFAGVDAQHLPFADATLDIVTCRVAAHHFPDAAQFVRECARVVRSGGVVGLVDQIGPGDPEAARYKNAYEKLRDPSHVWEYSQGEWEAFFVGAGLRVEHQEVSRSRLDFRWWTQMQNVDAETSVRLMVMLRQAPEDVLPWWEPEFTDDGGGSFALSQLIMIGRKT